MRFQKGSIEALEHMEKLRSLKTGGSFQSDKIAKILKNNPAKFDIGRVKNPSLWLQNKLKKEVIAKEPEEIYVPEPPRRKHFFSDWLEITESSNVDHAVNKDEYKYFDEMFDILDDVLFNDDVINQDIKIIF